MRLHVSKPLAIFSIFCVVFFLALYLHFSHMVDKHLRSDEWSLPSTIFAEPLTLKKGSPYSRSEILRYLKTLDYVASKDSTVTPGEYNIYADAIRFRNRPFLFKNSKDPAIEIRFDYDEIAKIVNLDTEETIESYQMEPVPIRNLFGEEWEKRTLVSFKDYPRQLINAVLAVEDRRFYKHFGVDVFGTTRALLNDVFSNDELQGGSTITQQLAKNFFLTPEKSINRKINEALLAMVIERRKTKQEILELYLNEIYMGQRGAMSIHGMGEASRVFFHKNIQSVNIPEAALLAGMISAPNALNPERNPKQATERRNIVLKGMLDQKTITKSQYESFTKVPIHAYPIESRVNLAPYFGDVVKTQLEQKYDLKSLSRRNLRVFTSLDLDMQQSAEESLARGLASIDRMRQRETRKKIQGCLIAIEPQTGYIKAFVGGRNYSKSQFNRINQASRQAGSIFKPVVYALAFERAFSQDHVFTPATLVEDAPWILKTATDTWQPRNYDNEYHGTVTLREALSKSMNIATAKLAAAIGFDDVAALGKKVGFEDITSYPSIALGAFEVSPWHVARAYTVFANGGQKMELRTVREMRDEKGKMLDNEKVEGSRVIHPQTAFLITDLMRSVISDGTASSMRSLGFTRPVAGKTGTTNDFRDAWFAGYTPDLLCVVWVGYDDNTPLKMTGAEAALPIWVDFMKKATAKMPARDFPVPKGIVTAVIDPTTGNLATPACPSTEQEYFIEGTEPTSFCTEHAYGNYSFNPDVRSRFQYRSQPRVQRRLHFVPKRAVKRWWRKLKFWG